MKTVIELINAERERQVSEKGWTPEHDDSHTTGQIARAAACYALPACRRYTYADGSCAMWPWEAAWWKPTPNDRIRELTKAGALIVAEMERLQRLDSANSDYTTSVRRSESTKK